jgi:hypothetical protein
VQGEDCIFVVVDKLKKFAHLFAIPIDYKAIQVAKLFFREVFQLHGLPRQVVNDRDGRFINAFWQEIFRLVGTQLATSNQLRTTDRWTDRYCQQMGGGVSEKLCGGKTTHMGDYCYNMTYHMSIRMSPFRALYGYNAPSFVETMFGDSRVPRAKDWIQESQGVLRVMKENLQAT